MKDSTLPSLAKKRNLSSTDLAASARLELAIPSSSANSPAGSCSGSEARLATAYVYQFRHDAMNMVCVAGFEPAAPRFQSENSNRTELHTEKRWCAPWDSNPEHSVFETDPTTNCSRGTKKNGARGGTRTHRTLILSQVRLPITSHAQNWP